MALRHGMVPQLRAGHFFGFGGPAFPSCQDRYVCDAGETEFFTFCPWGKGDSCGTVSSVLDVGPQETLGGGVPAVPQGGVAPRELRVRK